MPVSQDLLDILVCPETKQPVALAGDVLLARINKQIDAGELRSAHDDLVVDVAVAKFLRDRMRDFFALRPEGARNCDHGRCHFDFPSMVEKRARQPSPVSRWVLRSDSLGGV